MLEQFIKGEGDVVVNDILDIAKSSLPLRNEYLTKILNFFRDERRKEKGDDIRVEVAYPEGLDRVDGLLSRYGGDGQRGGRILDTVSQKGLRGVVSEDALVSFFKGVYNRVDNATRNEIYEYVKRNGNDFWKGTEQYLASLAETDAPLDGGVRDAFMQMLNNNGIEAEGLTDNDIRYMMWRTNQLKDSKGAYNTLPLYRN